MCYVVAKDFNKEGCFAMKTEHGKALKSLVDELIEKIGYDRIEMVVISRPSAYGEYAPYTIVHSEEEFKKAVLSM